MQDFYYFTVKEYFHSQMWKTLMHRINGIPSQEKIGSKPVLFLKKSFY